MLKNEACLLYIVRKTKNVSAAFPEMNARLLFLQNVFIYFMFLAIKSCSFKRQSH